LTSRTGVFISVLFASGCVAQCEHRPAGFQASFEIQTVLPADLLRQANHGRDVLGPDGRFLVPRGVRRAWIDVGAADLDTAPDEWKKGSDWLLIAVEPLKEYWGNWPDHARLVALPVALSIERGWLDFHVNRFAVTSSLLKSAEGTPWDELTKTVQIRKVPALRLEDVLERIPPEIDVRYLKTDVQGQDLQVLKSAGRQLRRVGRVKAEVTNVVMYKGTGEARPGTEAEFVAYMKEMGFRFEADSDVQPDRRWLDKTFVNTGRQ
jgi:FkbM family methyltransferase